MDVATTGQRGSARALVTGVVALVLLDLVGGLAAVASGVNGWGEAWGSEALMAAPLPMIAAQLLLTAGAVRWADRRGAGCAGLLAAACLVSAVSGFFDGGLGNEALDPAQAAFQVLLVAVTAGVGVLAALRAGELLR